MITSSAAGEDSQESERLQGGVFSHHFIAGLKGAADNSGDGKVTLTEAYRYGYKQTIATTSRAAVVQHPSYAFDMRGHEDLVLTWLDQSHSYGHLSLAQSGEYLVFAEDERGELIAEFSADSGTRLALSSGRYLVRLRGRESVYERTIEVDGGQTFPLDRKDMEAIPYGTTVRRGYDTTHHRYTAALTMDGSAAGPLTAGKNYALMSGLGMRFDFAPISLGLRFRYGWEQSQNTTLERRQQSFGGDLTLLKIFDLRWFSPGLGIRTGGDWVRQDFKSNGDAPTRSSAVWRGGPLLHLGFALGSRVSLYLEGGADINLLNQYEQASERSSLAVRVVPYGSLGLGVHLF